MATVREADVVYQSTDSVSLTGQVAVLLGSEENAIRMLFSLLLGLLCVMLVSVIN